MKFQLKLAALTLLALPLTACNVWTVPEFGDVVFNAEPGDVVNVEMQPAIIDGVHPWDRCMDYGGAGMRHETREVAVGTAPIPGLPDSHGEDVVLTAILSVLICESVDF